MVKVRKGKAPTKGNAPTTSKTIVYKRKGIDENSNDNYMDEAIRARLDPWLGVLNKHKILPEQGITLGTNILDDDGQISFDGLRTCMVPLYKAVAELGWVKFIEQLVSYCSAMVREFYAEVCESTTTVINL